MAVATPGEIFSRRICAAAASSVGVQIAFSGALVLVLRFDILHPGTWLSESARGVISVSLVQLALVTVAQAYIFARTCIGPPRQRFSRFYMLLEVFTLQNILFAVLYALSGYFTLSFYSSLANGRYADLRKLCSKSEGQCLVEESLFLECGGMWMGLCFFQKTHIFGTTILLFPHVHQEKIHQIRGSLFANAVDGFRDSVRPVLYFLLFYVLWGHKPRNVVSDVYSLYLEDAPLDNLLNLLGSGVWVTLWLYSSLFFLTMYNMRTVFNVFLTEPMRFPVTTISPYLCLQEALALRWKYCGLLAAHDYRQLACSDVIRRSEVFTVSLPGGHPRTWTGLLNETLTTVDAFNDELDSINNYKPNELEVTSAGSTDRQYRPPTMRNLAASPELLKDHKRLSRGLDDELTDTVKTAAQSLLQRLLQTPGIGYVFRELPDRKLRSLLTRAQPVMWTCEALAFIAAASLHEDRYGIVQRDLPIIIESLVRLKQNIEKLSKTGLIPKKQASSDDFAVKMKTALLSSVRRSIYKIIHTFSKYINDIPLSPELRVAIQPFVAYKEC